MGTLRAIVDRKWQGGSRWRWAEQDELDDRREYLRLYRERQKQKAATGKTT